jgi:hypothetical protein
MSILYSQLPAVVLAAYAIFAAILGKDYLVDTIFRRKRVSIVVDNVTLSSTLERTIFELLFVDCANDASASREGSAEADRRGAIRIEALRGFRFSIESARGFVEHDDLPADAQTVELNLMGPPFSDGAASLRISLGHDDSVRLRPMVFLPLRVSVHDAKFVRDWISYGRTLAHLPIFYQTATRAFIALTVTMVAIAATLAYSLQETGGSAPLSTALSTIAGLSAVAASVFDKRRRVLEDVLVKRTPLDA